MTEKELQDLKNYGYMFERFGYEKNEYPIETHFEFDSGWNELAFDLLEYIRKNDPLKIVRILQLKEKYGLLRCYTGYEYDQETGDKIEEEYFKKIDDIIPHFESASGFICEVCGHYGRPKGSYWIKTLCNVCFVKHS